jgi:hypothetical protein
MLAQISFVKCPPDVRRRCTFNLQRAQLGIDTHSGAMKVKAKIWAQESGFAKKY